MKKETEERGGGGTGETTELKAKDGELKQQEKWSGRRVWTRHRVHMPLTFLEVGHSAYWRSLLTTCHFISVPESPLCLT